MIKYFMIMIVKMHLACVIYNKATSTGERKDRLQIQKYSIIYPWSHDSASKDNRRNISQRLRQRDAIFP